MEGLVIGLDLNDDYSQISCNEKKSPDSSYSDLPQKRERNLAHRRRSLCSHSFRRRRDRRQAA